ncbi:MAG: cupin domain-containing protein, partial [Candidatus Hadarchaeota archaeon]|nr:cupin domain-containing protein [Candidatus Hadarchaeota archaeon]
MSVFIVRNLSEAEPQKRLCGRIWSLSNSEDFEEGNLSYFEASRPARPHYHKETTEMYFVISGRGKILVDKSEERLKRGTFVMIRPSTVHRVIPDEGSILKIVVCSIPAWKEED